jgi:hypothetical protein
MKRALTDALIEWKKRPSRMSLIVRGARQVGKTFCIEEFGKQHFDSFVSLNLEYRPEFIRCFESLDPKEILNRIHLLTGQNVIPGKTLLFIDEIQMSKEAILAMRYFKEMMPELHVIGAGSLLEFTLHDTDFNFPVGRVEFMYLHPLSFAEFLLANQQSPSLEFLKTTSVKTPPPDVVHDQLLKLVRHYFFLGGMPAVVDAYTQRQTLAEAELLQGAILDTYRSDFGKYAKKAEHKTLSLFFERAPSVVAKHFKFSKISQDIRSKDLRIALDQLCSAGLVSRVHATDASGVPLRFRMKENKFKLLFLDIGLLQRAHQVDSKEFLEKDLIQINEGALAEQFVGQELLACAKFTEEKRLYFWEREARGSSAEVDYVVNLESKIVPIEVKSSSTGRLRSLRRFMEEKKCEIGVQISEAPLTFEKGILSIPFYMIHELPRLLKEIF